MDALLENGWFINSQRFAVLIGKDAINSTSARNAVSKFVSNPEEGIINAADAATIAAEVQAKTIHTIQIATKHGVPTTGDGFDNDGVGVNSGDSGDDFGEFGDFVEFDGDFGGGSFI